MDLEVKIKILPFSILIILISSCGNHRDIESVRKVLDSNPQIPSIQSIKESYHTPRSIHSLTSIPGKRGSYILNSHRTHTADESFYVYVLDGHVLYDSVLIPHLVTYALIDEGFYALLYFVYFDKETSSLVILTGEIPVKFPFSIEDPFDMADWPNEVNLLLAVNKKIQFLDDFYLETRLKKINPN